MVDPTNCWQQLEILDDLTCLRGFGAQPSVWIINFLSIASENKSKEFRRPINIF